MTFAGRAPRRALVLSNTSPYLEDRPSRHRLVDTTSLLCAEGFEVDVVVHSREADLASQSHCDSRISPAIVNGRIYNILEGDTETSRNPAGWSATLDICLGSLCRATRYQLMWINDANLARAVAYAPGGCLTILDVRGGPARRVIVSTILDIFVTDAGAETTRISPDLNVRSIALPLVPDARARRPPGEDHTKLRVGFIGRDSPLNFETVHRFLRRLEATSPSLRESLTFVVAGGVSRCLRAEAGWIEILGHVRSLDHFYNGIDIAVAPFTTPVSSRPQIIEALAWDVPILATAMASAGLVTCEAVHAFSDVDTLVRCLASLARDRTRQRAIAAAAARAAAIMRRARYEGLLALKRVISRRRRRFIFVTDVAFLRPKTLAEERCRQVIEYFAHIMPIDILYLSACNTCVADPGLVPQNANLTIACLGGATDVVEKLRDLMSHGTVAGCLVSLVDANPIADIPSPRFLDCWPARAATAADSRQAFSRPDLQLDDGTWHFTAPLLHLPERLDWQDDPNAPVLLLVLIGQEVDETVVDLLSQVSPVGLAIIRSCSPATDTNLFACLEAIPRPAAIATIETSSLARELAATLAMRVGVAFFHLAGDQYPILLRRCLISNLLQHILFIADQLRDPRPSPVQSRSVDQGWNRMWARLAVNPIAPLARIEKPSRRAAT